MTLETQGAHERERAAREAAGLEVERDVEPERESMPIDTDHHTPWARERYRFHPWRERPLTDHQLRACLVACWSVVVVLVVGAWVAGWLARPVGRGADRRRGLGAACTGRPRRLARPLCWGPQATLTRSDIGQNQGGALRCRPLV